MKDWLWDRWPYVAGGAVVLVAVGVAAWQVWEEATEPHAGTVYDKQHTPWSEWETCTTDSQGVQRCTEHETEECWEVRYRDAAGDTGDDCVPEGMWADLHEGDWYER